MNAANLLVQTNQIFGNNVINPQVQQMWMNRPVGASNGLAYLRLLDSLMVKQTVSITEMIMGIPSQAKYGVFNDKGEQVYFAFEESDVCQRIFCATTRGFVLHIMDSSNQEVIRINREFKFNAGCCWCVCCNACAQEVVVESPPGTIIGFVTQQCSFWRMNFLLKDAANNPVLSIIGPGCICDGPYAACCENKFTLYGTDGITEIGAIHKRYRGFLAEALTTADTFTIRMPIDLDVNMKAVALGALFLIDYTSFSKPPQQN